MLTLRAQREEAISVGFDDFLELLGKPPYSTGIRIPPLVGPTYRVLAAVLDLGLGDTLSGMRQFASIAEYELQGAEAPPPAPAYPEWREVVTPGWHFSDTAPITWILTEQPLHSFVRQSGPFDQDSFIFRDTCGPALVYETATFPALPPLPGYLGLSAYAPPPILGDTFALLRDIRFPLRENEFWAIHRPIHYPTRIRCYVEVQQSNPATRFLPNFATGLSAQQLFFATGMSPEERFLQDFRNAIVHSVGASLVYDRE